MENPAETPGFLLLFIEVGGDGSITRPILEKLLFFRAICVSVRLYNCAKNSAIAS